MELEAARTLALTLIADHDLKQGGWTFDFDRAQHRLGQCNYGVKRITMGADYVLAADTEHVRQTLLHEVAHALVGSKAGHGRTWQLKARSIGYTGARTSDNPHTANLRSAALEKALAAAPKVADVRSGIILVGERVVSDDGRHSGLVVTVARTRCTVMVDRTATECTMPITYLRRENGGDRPSAPVSTVTARSARKPVYRGGVAVTTWFVPDQRVAINFPGRTHHGSVGTVESVGPKNVLVELDSGVRLRVPKALLRAA